MKHQTKLLLPAILSLLLLPAQTFDEAATGKNIRKSISIIMLSTDDSVAGSYTLFDCFPVRFSEARRKLAAETLTIKIGRIEFK